MFDYWNKFRLLLIRIISYSSSGILQCSVTWEKSGKIHLVLANEQFTQAIVRFEELFFYIHQTAINGYLEKDTTNKSTLHSIHKNYGVTIGDLPVILTLWFEKRKSFSN